jgi:hypothetical protein
MLLLALVNAVVVVVVKANEYTYYSVPRLRLHGTDTITVQQEKEKACQVADIDVTIDLVIRPEILLGLELQLEHKENTVTLFEKAICLDVNYMSIRFDDEADGPMQDCYQRGDWILGSYQPTSGDHTAETHLDAFDGLSAAGNWTLHFLQEDWPQFATNDVLLLSWSMDITCTTEPSDCSSLEPTTLCDGTKSSKKKAKGSKYPTCIWKEKKQRFETKCMESSKIASLKSDDYFLGCGCCADEEDPPSYCVASSSSPSSSFETNDAILVSDGGATRKRRMSNNRRKGSVTSKHPHPLMD